MEFAWKDFVIFFFLDTLITSHLSGLNFIDLFDSHFSNSCKLVCKVSGSDREFIVRL